MQNKGLWISLKLNKSIRTISTYKWKYKYHRNNQSMIVKVGETCISSHLIWGTLYRQVSWTFNINFNFRSFHSYINDILNVLTLTFLAFDFVVLVILKLSKRNLLLLLNVYFESFLKRNSWIVKVFEWDFINCWILCWSFRNKIFSYSLQPKLFRFKWKNIYSKPSSFRSISNSYVSYWKYTKEKHLFRISDYKIALV